ncbi:hypothetical protein AOC36_00815 [Erysipelothrix larvae]|uniref:histidine kinase n=1 Tax=Erysipelothrix larvae TaxID=1514105 RepID=A0A0X8GY58_9FIRM|nr:HAMP domain-containing sensor histidine kinase [Erysipelothrix larvae]AMC92584.1 hypothetical protein AOC36_00815 [Erysipelothrix larvae]
MILFIIGLLIGGILVYIILSHEIRGLAKQINVSRNFKTLSPIQIMDNEPSLNNLVYELNNLLSEYYDLIQYNDRMLQQLQQMTTSIAHDFRTPLTSMLGYIQIVQDSNLSDKDKERLSLVEKRIKVLNNHVEDFYMLSQLSSDEFPLSIEPQNPNRILQENLALYYDSLNQHFESIEINIGDDAITGDFDVAAFNRIISNLIKNALNHGSQYFSISTIRTSERTLNISFVNKGASESLDLNRIFDRTYRNSKDRSNASSGLGLSIAYELAKSMDMALSAHQSNDEITFTLTLYVR